ncbi:YitT family protein [Cetobacterium sp. 2A]|uniref:YitT family protein n=1 Tax=Cetobacterium sp. 2A TaxID=2754723 RepID=UPI00163CF142|nr:YitT family protein [Cetobacterium sp. 2A]MBC2855740.1 YitT family protein [Cetobacterium sp. 2A]
MKRKKVSIALDYFLIYVGTLIVAFGIDVFLVPANLAPGGVTGISIIINSFTGISLGNLIFVINIPIFLFGLKVFGKSYGLKTLLGISFLSINIDMIKYLIPSYGTLIDFTKGGNLFLAPIYGGLFMGIGLGIVIKRGGTTGGSDILSGIMNKYFKIPVGQALIIIDFFVITAAAYIFGVEKALYALINLYTTGIVINKVIEGQGGAKMAYIVTSKYKEVRDIIVNDLGKTGNCFKAEALYSLEKKDVIMTVLRNREVFILKDMISHVDKEAFVVISEVHEVMGRGYTFEVNPEKLKKL